MKILILSDYYPPDKLGGVGEIAKNLHDAYAAKGHDTWVLTTGTSPSTNRIIRGSKKLIVGVFVNNWRVIRLIRREQFDAINMHQSTTTLFLLTKHLPFLYKKFPKIVNSFQVSYFSEFAHIKKVHVQGKTFRPARKEYIEKWLFSPIHIILDLVGYIFSDEITVVSSENKAEFERSYGRLSRKTIRIIPNGIDTTAFSPRPSQLDTTFLQELAEKTVLLYVGVFRVRKRVFNLIFALADAVKQQQNVHLVLVGGGRDYEDDILALIKELGLTDHVTFVGKVPNEQVIEYLNAADVFCLLSSYEGMPIAILEAMASGKAILTSQASGMIDLIDSGTDGYLTTVDDTDDIAQKLDLLLQDSKKTTAMGKAARKKVIADYQWRHIADAYLEVFQA